MFAESIFSVQEWWERNGLECLVIASLVVIFILALFRWGKKGTWSSWYSYDTNVIPKNKGPPVQKKDSKGEVECRRVMEEMFGRRFAKSRPNFLRNPVTGNQFNLEIDCYCDELKLGVEYSGIQHYKYSPYFHKNHEAFLNQKYRDELKRRMCADNGISLIEVPYTVKLEQIRPYLIKELSKMGFLSY